MVDEALGVELAHRASVADLGVHDRLGVGRFVRLVMPPAPVADHVDDHVLLELVAELKGEVHHVDARLGVLAVDVEDRRLDHLRHVSRVHRGARVGRRGGEADAVVGDDVDGAAGAVAGQRAHVQRLGHHALSRERRVAVDQHREHLLLRGVALDVLQRAGHPLDDRIDRLEVAGVGGQLHADLAALRGLERAGGAEVVLDVAGPFAGERVEVPLELAEDLLVALADDVGQHVQPAAVGHPHHHVLEPGLHGAGEEPVEHRNQRLHALEREALVADVLGVEEALERLRRVEHRERPPLGRRVEPSAGVSALHPLLDPGLLVGLLDEHVLDAERAAVGLA